LDNEEDIEIARTLLYSRFKNSSGPKTYFTNCKL